MGENGDFLFLKPQGWADPVGYANGIMAPPGRVIFVAGQVGWDANQKFASDGFADQFGQALKNIVTVLAEAGAEAHHICRITAFCADKDAYFGARKELGAVWRNVMGRHYPAMSMIFVAGLVDEGAKIELEATAVIPD